MSDTLDQVRHDLALANRILANEGVLDAFGHVSVRHPADADRYLLSRSCSPELVEPADILEFTLDSAPVRPAGGQLYRERVIHGCVYQARPDVNAVVHCHAPALMPFCVSGVEIVPVWQHGAAMGAKVPFWDQRDEFGDTNLLIVQPEEGRSLARALGPYWGVLLRRHGAVIAGRSLRELVFRSIFFCVNAEFQRQAQALGDITTLSPGEIERAGSISSEQPGVMERTWEYWKARVEKTEC
jgi:HCOMODA/2-hydroxy-3-carboxy-muconic semialdehyde decarboxylase